MLKYINKISGSE